MTDHATDKCVGIGKITCTARKIPPNNNRQQYLWCCHHDTVFVRVYSIHLMNKEPGQVAANH